MKIYIEKNLEDFEAWSGAVDTMDTLYDLKVNTDIEVWTTLESILEEENPDGMGETELNDFLWFENDTIAEWLGFDNWEALEKVANGEEDEEEEEEEEIKLDFAVDDIVKVNDRKAIIVEIDTNDKDLPFFVEYIDGDERAVKKEWCGVDEVEKTKLYLLKDNDE